MNLSRRHVCSAAVALGLAAAAPPALAQIKSFPDKPVRLIVSYPPGGTVDAVARILGPKLSALWGQPVVIDNRGGAGGIVGADAVIKSPADGYTLLVDASNHAQNPALKKSMPFDTVRALQSVSLLAKVPTLLVVNPNYDARTVQALIAKAKAKPESIDYASSGNGSAQHLSGELFQALTHTKLTHVAYKGGGPAMVDVMGGQVPVFFGSLASTLPFVKSGKLAPVAVASARRSPVLPEVPTFAEAGLKGYEIYEWNGVFAPAGTPAAVVDKISKDIATALGDREVNARLIALGAEVIGSTPADLEKFRAAEIAKWKKLAQTNNISLD